MYVVSKVGFENDFNPPTSLNMIKLKEQRGKKYIYITVTMCYGKHQDQSPSSMYAGITEVQSATPKQKTNWIRQTLACQINKGLAPTVFEFVLLN